MLLEEVFIYGVSALYGSPDNGLEGQLINDSRDAFSQMKDQLDGIIG